jgi:RNA polymerase sigma-70 factor (ECF subfamily)
VTDALVSNSGGTTTSTSLLNRAIERQPDAWERLVNLYGPLVYQWCRRWGLQPGDAENVGQEVFLRVARHLPRFRREAASDSFRGWLHRIARNCFIDHHRGLEEQPRSIGGSDGLRLLVQVADQFTDARDDTVSADEDSAVLYRQVVEFVRGQFSERDWTAFTRIVLERHSPSVVAAELKVSTNVIYLAKSRVLRRLREEFAELLDF